MFLRGIRLQLGLCFVIVASFVLTIVEGQMIEINPQNIGVRSDEPNVVLDCRVNGLPVNAYIEWIYYPSWEMNGTLIYSTYNGINNDPTNFTVYHWLLGTDTHSLELVIKTAKRELATQYLCRLTPISGFEKIAHVVALDPIECPGDIVEYDEGNEANLSCSVNYYDSTLTYFPTIRWYRDGQTVSGDYVISESLTRRTTILTKNVTSVDDDQKFDCIVDFYLSNSNYNDSCSTIFYVRHTVSEINFYPFSNAEFPINVAVGGTIKCTANGRPAPTIQWYNIDGNLLSQFSELTVNEDMRTWKQPITVQCRANNTIDKGQTSAEFEGNYTFNVADANVVQSSGVEAWVIAVSVVVPIVVLAAIAIAVFFVIRHREMKKKSTQWTNVTEDAASTHSFDY